METPKEPRRGRWKRLLLGSLAGLLVYLAAESLLPPRWQPSARLGVALIRAYQSIGSPALRAMGARCRYEPSCSHYAEEAIAHYGTLRGLALTVGRLWRCAPWGGSGYDPAI